MKTTEIHWEVTNQCNLHCSYCRSDSGKPRLNELSTAEALAILKKVSDAGIKRICYTGGEPFFRPDFKDLLEETVRLKMKAAVITNATLIDQKTISLIKALKVELSISLDGAAPDINDRQRGAGTFSKALKVIELCRSSGIKPYLCATISHDNIGHLESLMQFAADHDSPIRFKEISVGGRASDSYGGLLSPREESRLKDFVPAIIKEIFEDETVITDEDCWADGRSLFMSAEGDLYFCNEIFVRQPGLKLGNAKSFDFNRDFKKSQAKLKCCSGALVSKNTAILYRTPFACEFLADLNSPIETLKKLYQELDNLYEGIGEDCSQCRENDCMGYIWLLKAEANRLYRSGTPLVQINEGPTFIHSFPKDESGGLNLSARYPVCSQVDCSGRVCLIRKKRPLVCHIYPGGLETLENGKIVWVMHLDCLYVKKMEEQGLINNLGDKFVSIINRISPPLLNEIMETYKAVNAISAFPNGSNKFKILKGGI